MSVIALAGDWHGNGPWACARVMSVGERGIRTLTSGTSVSGRDLRARSTCSKSRRPARGTAWTSWSPRATTRTGAVCALCGMTHLRGVATSTASACHCGSRTTSLSSPAATAGRWRVVPSSLSVGRRPSTSCPTIELWVVTGGRRRWSSRRTSSSPWLAAMRMSWSPTTPLVRRTKRPVWSGSPSTTTSVGPTWKPAYAAVGTERMHQAFLGVAPQLFVHGHYHTGGEAEFALPGRDYPTRIWSLDRDGSAKNLRLLDLETLNDPVKGGVQ